MTNLIKKTIEAMPAADRSFFFANIEGNVEAAFEVFKVHMIDIVEKEQRMGEQLLANPRMMSDFSGVLLDMLVAA